MSHRQRAAAYLAAGTSLSFCLAGCRGTAFIEGGPEIRYLTSTPPPAKALKIKGQSLLPLSVGTRWEMRQIGVSPNKRAKIDIRVVKRDGDGSLMEIRKNGQMWRREVYRETASGLFLTGMGEDDKPMMRLSPPVPVILFPAAEGSAKAWNGTFQYGDLSYPASAYSRISALETTTSPAGKRLAFRTDTIIEINQDGSIVKFPTLRWLTPGLGFVQRSFVEQGRPLYVRLQRFTPG